MNELALTVTLNNDNAFGNLTKEQTIMIFQTFKDAKYNKCLMNMRNKYITYGIYNNMHSAIISLAFGNNKNDMPKILDSHNKINGCLSKIYDSNEEIQDAFIRLFLAEYKELVYGSLHVPHFERIETDILAIYENIIAQNKEYYDVYNHWHDPTHYMFVDKKYMYDFYDAFESKGMSVFDEEFEEWIDD